MSAEIEQLNPQQHKTNPITLLDLNETIDAYVTSKNAPDGEEPPPQGYAFAWIEKREVTLGMQLSADSRNFLRVFCNGIPNAWWQVLDEQARMDFITNAHTLATCFGGMQHDGSYYPGSVAAVAYTTLEAVMARRAAATTVGIPDVQVTLADVVLDKRYQGSILNRVSYRIMGGQYTEPLRTFCPRCGNEIPNTANFCISCGADARAEVQGTPIKPRIGPPATDTTTRLA